MNKFWKWMRSNGCNQFNPLFFDTEEYNHVNFFPSKLALIGYMIQFLLEETNTKNIEIVKDNFNIYEVYNLLKKAIEDKTK